MKSSNEIKSCPAKLVFRVGGRPSYSNRHHVDFKFTITVHWWLNTNAPLIREISASRGLAVNIHHVTTNSLDVKCGNHQPERQAVAARMGFSFQTH